MSSEPGTIDPDLSPNLQGAYAPVYDELDVGDLEVRGHIPAALNGVFMRTGPNPEFAPLGKYHIFDGDGMVHAVYLEDGKARYKNRWVESRGLLAERAAGKALYGGLANFVMPDPETVAAGGILKNTGNTNIVRHGDRYLALLEAAPPTELDRELGTIGECDFDGQLAGAMAAHPKWDPKTGELVFFGYSPFPPFLTYHVADKHGRLVRSEPIEIPTSVMMHDFVVTDRYAVFFDLPAVFNAAEMLNGGPPISWQPDNGARIGVLPRDGGNDDVRWFDVDPFYVFHFLNGWNSADGSVVEVLGCRASEMPTAFGDDEPPEGVHPSLHRWLIDLTTGVVKDEPVDDRWGDFPRFNMQRSGQENRYGYLADSTHWEPDDVVFDSVVKHDLTQGTSQRHAYGAGRAAGEPVFAPDPDGDAEDDGWILNFVLDRDTETSTLTILDAHDLEADPVAEIVMPRRVPAGFHGNWMPERGDLPTN